MNDSEHTMIRYLLGELSEAEQSALEQEYFTGRRVFDQVVQAEHQLVDDYVRGELSTQARTRLEQYYLAHPQRRERVKFAEALAVKLNHMEAAQATERRSQAESWWGRLIASLNSPKLLLGFSTALLLIAVGGAWFLIESRRLRQELAQTQAAQADHEQRERELEQQVAGERMRAEQLTAELKRQQRTQPQMPQTAPTPTVRSMPAFVSLVLTFGGVRGADTGGPTVLVIPLGTEQVRMQLNLKENDYTGYRVSLRQVGGGEIFSRQGLNPRTTKAGASFSFIVPAHKFTTGDYILTLRGVSQAGEIEDLSKSIFRVEKK